MQTEILAALVVGLPSDGPHPPAARSWTRPGRRASVCRFADPSAMLPGAVASALLTRGRRTH